MTERRSPLDTTSLLSSLAALGFGGLLIAQIQPTFWLLLEDLGAEVSLLTRVAMSPAYAAVAGLGPLTLSGVALALSRTSPARPALQVTAMVIALSLPVAFFLGAYLPIMELSAKLTAAQ